MLGFIIGIVVIGFAAGFIARALVPGRDPMSALATTLLGIVGSFIGGFLADVFFHADSQDKGLHAVGLVGSVVGAVIALLLYRATSGNRRLHHR